SLYLLYVFFSLYSDSLSYFYSLSLHDALPISLILVFVILFLGAGLGQIKIKGLGLGSAGVLLIAIVFGHFGYQISPIIQDLGLRSEEHTSEIQSRFDIVCRLLLE